MQLWRLILIHVSPSNFPLAHMSSESESTNEKSVPVELNLGDSASIPKKAAKKVARKVAKKVARKVAKKVTPEEGVTAASAKPVEMLRVSPVKVVAEKPNEFLSLIHI